MPVVQLSLQTLRGPRHHVLLGRVLAPLAREGVLILGSGHLTHNLREMRSARDTSVGAAEPYVTEFQEWVRGGIESRDLDRLQGYRRLSAGGGRAHPTEEHFLPLFVGIEAAMESCTLCEHWSAHKAKRLGLITEIVPSLKIDGEFVPNPLVVTDRWVDARGNLAQHAVEGRDPIARVLLHVPGGQSADQPVRRASLGDHAAGVEIGRAHV